MFRLGLARALLARLCGLMDLILILLNLSLKGKWSNMERYMEFLNLIATFPRFCVFLVLIFPVGGSSQ